MDEKIGVFSDQLLAKAIAAGQITGPDLLARVQPSSLDLSLGQRAFRLRASFLPGDRSVADCLTEGLVMHEIDLTGGAVLERGCVYLVELRERLALPADVAGHANPKSSTGRIDTFVRLVTDGASSFERVSAGYTGPLYAEISPKTFSLLVRDGVSLNQLRLRRGGDFLRDDELREVHGASPLASDSARIDGGLLLSVSLTGATGEVIGYRARRHAGLIDVGRVGALDPADYWEPIYADNGSLILDPDEFYILASREWLRVPETLAGEMVAIDPLLGEFRVHYAGFFDPGFGMGAGEGSRAVLEVRGHEAPFRLEHGQPVARLAYERLAAPPEQLYGQDINSNYQGQGLKLSKHFR